MTKTEINEYIHTELMELCWHEWEWNQEKRELVGANYICTNFNCGKEIYLSGFGEMLAGNPDYHTPEGFFLIRDKLVEIYGENKIYLDFSGSREWAYYNGGTVKWVNIDPLTFPSLVTQWMKERKEKV